MINTCISLGRLTKTKKTTRLERMIGKPPVIIVPIDKSIEKRGLVRSSTKTEN